MGRVLKRLPGEALVVLRLEGAPTETQVPVGCGAGPEAAALCLAQTGEAGGGRWGRGAVPGLPAKLELYPEGVGVGVGIG